MFKIQQVLLDINQQNNDRNLMITVGMFTNLFQATYTVAVSSKKGSLENSIITDPPPFTKKSNLLELQSIIKSVYIIK